MLSVPLNINKCMQQTDWSVKLRWVDSPMALPRVAGIYILLMQLNETTTIKVGELGDRGFRAGYYFYVGSAEGLGGLASSVGYYWLNKPIEHSYKTDIDYIRRGMTLRGTWLLPEDISTIEVCDVVQSFNSKCRVISHLGSVDCGCDSHLLCLPQ